VSVVLIGLPGCGDEFGWVGYGVFPWVKKSKVFDPGVFGLDLVWFGLD